MKKRKIEILELVLVFLFVIKYYGTYIGYENFSKYFMAATIGVSLILCLIKIKKYNLAHLLIGVVFGLHFLATKNITILYAYIMCLGLLDADFKRIIKYYMIINAFMLSLYLVMNLTGIKPTEYLEGRNDFGFGNPNTAFVSMFLVWISYFYSIFYSRSKRDYAVLILMIFLMYTQTMTRTGLLSALATFVAYLILKSVDTRKRIHSLWISSFPILMTLLSLLIGTVLSNNWLLNNILSHRPIYWHTYIAHPTSGINLLGYASNIRDILFTQRMPLDSGYLWSLYSMGLLSYAVMILSISFSLYKLCKEDKKDMILLTTGILVYCFAESIMIDLATNISLLLIAYGVGRTNIKKLADIFVFGKKNIKNDKVKVRNKE